MTWLVVVLCSAGCYALKRAGLAVPVGLAQRPVVARLVPLLPVPLLAALVVVGAVADRRALVADARLVGLAVAGVLVWRRAPFLVVVVAATLATAVTRLVA